ncbi:MAG: hypothetical protein HBSAPP03_11020 [Phycisphaerae bacterium]|nr:MAG: hypothetical protein HBSAPP03_11020 [Phycisphaerae bacterium]
MNRVDEWVREARAAAPLVAGLDHATRAAVLRGVAECFEHAGPLVQMMNGKDVQSAHMAGLPDAEVARVRITPDGLARAVSVLNETAAQPDPIGAGSNRKPLGLVLVCHQADPMFTAHAFARCFIAGNACVIRGCDRTPESGITLMKFIQAVLEGHGLPVAACSVIARATPEEIADLLSRRREFDLALEGEAALDMACLTA